MVGFHDSSRIAILAKIKTERGGKHMVLNQINFAMVATGLILKYTGLDQVVTLILANIPGLRAIKGNASIMLVGGGIFWMIN